MTLTVDQRWGCFFHVYGVRGYKVLPNSSLLFLLGDDDIKNQGNTKLGKREKDTCLVHHVRLKSVDDLHKNQEAFQVTREVYYLYYHMVLGR